MLEHDHSAGVSCNYSGPRNVSRGGGKIPPITLPRNITSHVTNEEISLKALLANPERRNFTGLCLASAKIEIGCAELVRV